MFDVSKLMAAQDGNRRYDRRVDWNQEIRYRIDQGPFQRAKVKDVSRSGLRLELPKALTAGSTVQVLYVRPDTAQQHWVEGKVRWSRERATRYLTGVEIEHCSSFDQLPYEKLLAALEVA